MKQEDLQATLLAELALWQHQEKEFEVKCLAGTGGALDRYDRVLAQGYYELAAASNERRQMMNEWSAALANRSGVIVVVDSAFLCSLVRHLTPGRDEEVCYVTGVQLGNVGVLSRIQGVQLAEHSAVYARSSAQSAVDALVNIAEAGNRLLAMAHSHPGHGAGATRQSSIDVGYLGGIQRAGSDAIGIIVTRDGWVRFWTVLRPFSVLVQGNGVNQLEEHVYQVAVS